MIDYYEKKKEALEKQSIRFYNYTASRCYGPLYRKDFVIKSEDMQDYLEFVIQKYNSAVIENDFNLRIEDIRYEYMVTFNG